MMWPTSKPSERSTAIGRGLATLARGSLALALIAVGVVILGTIVSRLWVVLLPLLLAIVVATVLWPPVGWLRRKGLPPAPAALVVVLSALLVLAGAIIVVVPPLVGQVDDIATSASDGLARVQEWLTGPPLNLSESQINSGVQSITDRLQSSATSIAAGIITGVSAVTSALVTVVVVLFLVFFFLKDGPRFLPWLRRSVGARAGVHIEAVLQRAWDTVGSFVRSQAAVGLIDGILIGAGLLIVGVPLAIPLAVLTFLGGFVPIIGAFVAGALAVLIALVSLGVTQALIVLAIVIGVQQIEGNILQPILQGNTLNLHQAVILLGVTAGGSLYGIAGAFFAVPVVAVLAEILRYVDTQLPPTPEPVSRESESS